MTTNRTLSNTLDHIPDRANPPVPKARKRHLIWKLLVVLSVAALVAYATKRFTGDAHARATNSGSPGAGVGAAVSVIAGTVEVKDVPIYLDGLGTIQALNTVTARARVDGEIKKVAFVEGQDVKAGDLLVQIDDAPIQAQLAQSVARKAQDEAQLVNARLDFNRDQELLTRKVIAQQQFDTQKALENQLEATVKADAAAIESAKVQLGYTHVVSPIDGRAGIRLVDQGNVVRAGDQSGLVVITQLQPISLIFTLPEQTLGEIHKQQQQSGNTELTVLAVDRENRAVLDEGKLKVIDNEIDTTTGTIKLKATFPNKDLQLWPGQFVNTRLLLSVRKDGIVVPSSVVQRGPQGPFAFVIKSDDSVEIRPLKVAQTETGEALIDEGLRPGERVVVDGHYKLQAGSRVEVSRSELKGGNAASLTPAGASPLPPSGRR